jgi:hypothetical protein
MKSTISVSQKKLNYIIKKKVISLGGQKQLITTDMRRKINSKIGKGCFWKLRPVKENVLRQFVRGWEFEKCDQSLL